MKPNPKTLQWLTTMAEATKQDHSEAEIREAAIALGLAHTLPEPYTIPLFAQGRASENTH